MDNKNVAKLQHNKRKCRKTMQKIRKTSILWFELTTNAICQETLRHMFLQICRYITNLVFISTINISYCHFN